MSKYLLKASISVACQLWKIRASGYNSYGLLVVNSEREVKLGLFALAWSFGSAQGSQVYKTLYFPSAFSEVFAR